MVDGTKLPLITLCFRDAERMRDAYELHEIRNSERRGTCEWCRKPKEYVMQYEYETKKAAAARRAKARRQQPGAQQQTDSRARYREPWRKGMNQGAD